MTNDTIVVIRWHTDDLVHFPLPEGHAAHSTAAAPPVFVLQAH